MKYTIEKHGKKEFAVIPYKEFLLMQEQLEDYSDLRELRKAKADPQN
jgi:PHD/YefM family antitoxin component YafN of YafNO toxin-antitoxin module